MAQRPTEKEIESTITATEKEVAVKVKEFTKNGKQFVYDSYGPGVVPEDQWTKFPREKQNG